MCKKRAISGIDEKQIHMLPIHVRKEVAKTSVPEYFSTSTSLFMSLKPKKKKKHIKEKNKQKAKIKSKFYLNEQCVSNI